MAETQDPVGALFREGKLMPAIEAANAAVRKNPADLGSRILLAELLLFTGNVERADVILDAAAQADPTRLDRGRRIPPIAARRNRPPPVQP
jgi:type VI secretion system protein ImpE